MIKESGIDFVELADGEFDNPMGLSTGAADIFGVTGGVMEAALRTVYEIITGRELPFEGLHVAPIAGLDKVKSASFTLTDVKPEWSFLEGVEVAVAVTNGLSGASFLMDEIVEGKSGYLFIEVMGCPGGCISGGGQPRPSTREVKVARSRALYREDDNKTLRKSHENPDITKLYKDFLGTPNGHVSHELLHTKYTSRNRT
jgi:NADH-quinone oxidoreductase subunit G/NADP-reducing hydrogenase subunit HndD